MYVYISMYVYKHAYAYAYIHIRMHTYIYALPDIEKYALQSGEDQPHANTYKHGNHTYKHISIHISIT